MGMTLAAGMEDEFERNKFGEKWHLRVQMRGAVTSGVFPMSGLRKEGLREDSSPLALGLVGRCGLQAQARLIILILCLSLEFELWAKGQRDWRQMEPLYPYDSVLGGSHYFLFPTSPKLHYCPSIPLLAPPEASAFPLDCETWPSFLGV